MKPSVVRKAGRIAEDPAAKRRTHYFFWRLEETCDMLQARMRAKVASGEAREDDEFVIHVGAGGPGYHEAK